MNFISALNELEKLYESVETDKLEEAVTEATTEEVEEESVEEVVINDEDELATEETEEDIEKALVLECSKCGALVIRNEEDFVVDEETGLANIEEECAYCGEAAGYKAIGMFEAYTEAPEEEIAEEPSEEIEEAEEIEEVEIAEEPIDEE